MKENEVILCRCENLTLERLHQLLDEGVTSMQEIKRKTRCTMGNCQGKTCKQLIAAEIASYLGKSVDEIDIPINRLPIQPVTLGEIAGKEQA